MITAHHAQDPLETLSQAVVTLLTLMLNSDLFIRSDFFSPIVFLNVADIRFQCELVAVLNCPACAKEQKQMQDTLTF